jgi:anti-anti-sigma factor
MATDETYALRVKARPENLSRIAAFIGHVAERCDLGPKEAFDIQMAVDEACTNIIEHGYQGDESGIIEINYSYTDDECCITLRDFGAHFDPDAVPQPDIHAPLEERPIGGLGLYFMRELMDSVEFEFDPEEGNVLTMIKRRKLVDVRKPAGAPEVRTVIPRGRLDADLAQELESVLEDLIGDDHHQLVIDFSQTSYISSSGLRVLLVALRQARTHRGDVKLANLQPRVRKVFNMSGFDQIFAIYESAKEAAQAFASDMAGGAS